MIASDYRALVTRREASGVDEHALTGDQLDRATLIRAVLQQNQTLESARNAWSAALARYREAGAVDDPMVRIAVAPMSVGSSAARFGYEVEATQRIPLGGKLDAQSAIAAVEAETVADAYRETRLQLALAASQLFDDYALAVRALEIHAQHVELVGALKESADAAYASNRSEATASLDAEAELVRLEVQRSAYQTARDVAIAQLNGLLHRSASARLSPPRPDVPLRDGEQDASSSQAIERRPDLATAKTRVRFAEARANAARRDYAPDLTLSASYNSMWDMPQHRFMLGLGVDVPLARERRAAAVEEAIATRAAAENALESMTDAARAEAAIASRELAHAKTTLQLYEQRLVPLARARVGAVRSGFTTAQSPFAAWIDAERNLWSEELAMERARAELNKRSAALDVALGRMPTLERTDELP